MNFASDNVAGASAPVLEALVRANEGPMAAYGADPITRGVEASLRRVFAHDALVAVPVATGTAANALALATCVPPYGLCVCHAEAHVIDDECGAPEFYTHGAKLGGLPGASGKIDPGTLDRHLAALPRHVKQMPASALSLSQATEAGTVYGLDEIAALARVAHAHGLKVHMDGARFANALVALDASPAAMTWQAGVDILSFGATKNGCLAAEAIVVFDPALAETLEFRRKRAGHILSKSRLISAQLAGYLADDHWLANARHANAMAARLADGLEALPGVRVGFPRAVNEVFPILPVGLDRALREAGAVYHPWATGSLPEGVRVGEGEVLVRLVTAFATRESDVDALLDAGRAFAHRAAA